MPESDGDEHGQNAPSDLIDFYRRWPAFRRIAAQIATDARLSPAERETVHWLILLVDRVSDRDLEAGKRQ